jgi:hypothetical protein
MKAVAIITECSVESSTPAGNVTVVAQFSTDDIPRTGIVVKNMAIAITEAQMELVVKQAVAEYINKQRASSVIQPSDVRLL